MPENIHGITGTYRQVDVDLVIAENNDLRKENEKLRNRYRFWKKAVKSAIFSPLILLAVVLTFAVRFIGSIWGAFEECFEDFQRDVKDILRG